VPLIQSGKLLGVLDLDSPEPGRFDREDAAGLEMLVRLLLEGSDFGRLRAEPRVTEPCDQRDLASTGWTCRETGIRA